MFCQSEVQPFADCCERWVLIDLQNAENKFWIPLGSGTLIQLNERGLLVRSLRLAKVGVSDISQLSLLSLVISISLLLLTPLSIYASIQDGIAALTHYVRWSWTASTNGIHFSGIQLIAECCHSQHSAHLASKSRSGNHRPSSSGFSILLLLDNVKM